MINYPLSPSDAPTQPLNPQPPLQWRPGLCHVHSHPSISWNQSKDWKNKPNRRMRQPSGSTAQASWSASALYLLIAASTSSKEQSFKSVNSRIKSRQSLLLVLPTVCHCLYPPARGSRPYLVNTHWAATRCDINQSAGNKPLKGIGRAGS